MASRTVLRRGLMVSAFSATINTCAEKIGLGFRTLSEPFLQPGEIPPDVTLMVRLLGRIIASRFQALLSRDRANVDERANDAAPRSERDELAKIVHGKLVEFRQVCDVAFGEEYARTIVPIKGRTANTPSLVHKQGEHTVTRFLSPDSKKRESKVPGLAPDLSLWARDLEPVVTRLGVVLKVIEKERLRASESVLRKQ